MKRMASVLLGAVLLGAVLLGARDTQAQEVPDRSRGVVTLSDVLGAVAESHPQIEEALALVEIAEGRSLEADGGFDPKARLGVQGLPVGEYTKGQVAALVTQDSPLWGTQLYAGWRRGFGDVPIYDGQLETLTGGEFRAGIEVPLWRGGPIDRTRADIAQADAGVARSRDELRAMRLILSRLAAGTYWSWVEAGQQLAIAEELLEVAEERVGGLERRIEAGSLEPLIAIDNQRTILDRQTKAVASRRELAQKAIELSLFLRTPDGTPIRPSRAQLPEGFPEPEAPSLARLRRDVRHAREQRPDLLALRHALRQADIEADLAETNVAPQVNVQAWVAKDIGSGPEVLRPLDIGLGATVEIPLLLRKDRGKAKQARGKLGALRAKMRLAGDQVETEVRKAFAALDAAYETVALARQARRATDQLAAAERRRLELGETDILVVNLRELAAAAAAASEASALADYHQARADYLTAAGRSLR